VFRRLLRTGCAWRNSRGVGSEVPLIRLSDFSRRAFVSLSSSRRGAASVHSARSACQPSIIYLTASRHLNRRRARPNIDAGKVTTIWTQQGQTIVREARSKDGAGKASSGSCAGPPPQTERGPSSRGASDSKVPSCSPAMDWHTHQIRPMPRQGGMGHCSKGLCPAQPLDTHGAGLCL
jgi:hypothetical protein